MLQKEEKEIWYQCDTVNLNKYEFNYFGEIRNKTSKKINVRVKSNRLMRFETRISLRLNDGTLKTFSLARLLFLLYNGIKIDITNQKQVNAYFEKSVVMHVNGDKTDFSKDNLKVVLFAEYKKNCEKKHYENRRQIEEVEYTNDELLNEIWIDVPLQFLMHSSDDGIYKISNLGRVRKGDKILRMQRDRNNYERFVKFNTSIHTMVAKIWIPNPQNKPYVDHINNRANDNRVSNLRWVTSAENANNDYTKRMKLIGMEKSQCLVPVIVTSFDGGVERRYKSIMDVSREFKIKYSTIECALRRKKEYNFRFCGEKFSAKIA